jgi:hypothetical protein
MANRWLQALQLNPYFGKGLPNNVRILANEAKNRGSIRNATNFATHQPSYLVASVPQSALRDNYAWRYEHAWRHEDGR